MPALLTPFLTDLDSRAAIKGSRDPLGLVPLWSRFGRTVVGSLTTASGTLRGFTTLLLGHWFAERVQERDGREAESTLELFLKFEQLAGYVRVHINDDTDLRGIDRVRLNLARGSKVPIGAEQDRQILSNQLTYGLWGLYSTPAASSGLLVPGEYILTSEARRFVEQHYIPWLSAEGVRDGRAVVDLLRRKSAEVHLDGRDATLAQGLARLLEPRLTAAEREFYEFHLIRGGPTDQTAGRQALLAELLADIPDPWFGFPELRSTIGRARRRAGGEPLAERLRDIEHLESVIVPLDNAFLHLLALFAGDRDRGAGPGKAAGSALRVLDHLLELVIVSSQCTARRSAPDGADGDRGDQGELELGWLGADDICSVCGPGCTIGGRTALSCVWHALLMAGCSPGT